MTLISDKTVKFCFVACHSDIVARGHCSCNNRSELKLNIEAAKLPIKVVISDNSVMIDNLNISFETKEIKSELEELFEVNFGATIFLPKKYSYIIIPSELYGKVAKITKAK